MDNIQQEVNPKTRKSLALDVRTYNMLQDICNSERRTKIDQLKVLIEREHKSLFSERVNA
ncbi:MAG: hypothetical protein CMF74_18135 [Maricaulis sp.]|jgi:hypothetical protein|nr:hypothetical protein [Maricaulis sp.]